MYRGPFRAAVALLQLLAFLGVQLAEGTGVHRCPEHDAGAGIVPAGAHAMHDMAAMEGHAGHGSAPEQAAHTACHCIGACTTATVAMPGPAAPGLAPVTVAFRPPVFSTAVSLRGTVRLLPFAIGPPLLA